MPDYGRLGGLLTQVAATSGDNTGRLGGLLVQVAATTGDNKGRLGGLLTQVAYSYQAVSGNIPNVAEILGNPVTFDSSESTGSISFRTWSWLSVPGGSTIANSITPYPDDSQPTPLDMTNNEVLYHCEETSGTTGTDSSGNYNSCTLTSINVGAGGKIQSYSWEYTGSTSVAEVGTPVSLSGDYTIAFWFYNLAPNSNYRTGVRGTNHHPIIVEGGSNRVGVYNNTASTFVYANFDMAEADYTGWHHMVVVGYSGKTDFYVDGAYKGTAQFKSDSDIVAIGNIQPAITTNQRFADRIDEFAAWSRALSRDEIREIYYLQEGNYAAYSDSTEDTFSFYPDVVGTYTIRALLQGEGTLTDQSDTVDADAVITSEPVPPVEFIQPSVRIAVTKDVDLQRQMKVTPYIVREPKIVQIVNKAIFVEAGTLNFNGSDTVTYNFSRTYSSPPLVIMSAHADSYAVWISSVTTTSVTFSATAENSEHLDFHIFTTV